MGVDLSRILPFYDRKFSDNILAIDIDSVEEPKDPRRRNSLAFNIATFVRLDINNRVTDTENPEETDIFEPILKNLRAEKDKIVYRVRAATAKHTKIAESVLHGSMKEIRDQTMQSYRTINRKYRDQFLNKCLIHLVCQEGYYSMLEFIINPKNHSVFEDTELIINPKDTRGRIPLFMCFTPPTATFLGITYGLTPEGTPVSCRPAGINSTSDWIQPGNHFDRENCIKLLIDNGADVNACDYHKYTSLHYASIWGWVVTVKRLIAAGADINAMNSNGRTSLLFAVEYGHIYVIEFLLTKAALLLNAADSEGNTAVILAVLSNHRNSIVILEILLKAKADLELMNSKNKSALHLACENQNIDAINLLFDYNVDRKESCIALLKGSAEEIIRARIETEEHQAIEAEAEAEKERILRARDGMVDLRYMDPHGKWIVLKDKRSGQMFYYNTVSRVSQKKMPLDYIHDPTKIMKEVTYGMHFYHL